MKIIKKCQYLATTSLALIMLSSPAFADDAKVVELEKQLNKALKLIEAQSDQMQALQKEIKSIKGSKVHAGASSGSSSGLSRSQRLELEERLNDVEDLVYDLDERTGGQTLVNAFDAVNFDIGGFINTAYTYVDGEDGEAKAFNRQNFEILIRADLNEQWSAFFAGGFLREGDVTFTDAGARTSPDFTIGNATPQIIGWFNYKHNDAFNLRLGRQITPHGIINIEHFPATLLDQEQPQFLRPFSGETIFPNFTTGLQAHGNFFVNDGDTLTYSAYLATAQSSPEEHLYGGRLAYNINDWGVTIGGNLLVGTRDEGTDSDYSVIGADLLIDKGPILWKTEIYQTDEDFGPDRFAFYTQPAVRFNSKWTGFYRYDFLDDGVAGQTTGFFDDGDTTEHVVGVNFLPIPSVRMRLTATQREFDDDASFDDAEAQIYQFSTTFSF